MVINSPTMVPGPSSPDLNEFPTISIIDKSISGALLPRACKIFYESFSSLFMHQKIIQLY